MRGRERMQARQPAGEAERVRAERRGRRGRPMPRAARDRTRDWVSVSKPAQTLRSRRPRPPKTRDRAGVARLGARASEIPGRWVLSLELQSSRSGAVDGSGVLSCRRVHPCLSESGCCSQRSAPPALSAGSLWEVSACRFRASRQWPRPRRHLRRHRRHPSRRARSRQHRGGHRGRGIQSRSIALVLAPRVFVNPPAQERKTLPQHSSTCPDGTASARCHAPTVWCSIHVTTLT
jgi:hypothetical protein